MSSDAGGRPEVKGMTGHPPAVCSRVWPRRRERNDDRRLTSGMVERAVDASMLCDRRTSHIAVSVERNRR